MFPADVVARAREYRAAIGKGGTGSYSHSQGIMKFRELVCEYIEERDGHPAFPGDIFLTNGASTGISNVLGALMSANKDALMIPIPQACIGSLSV
jgi:alanine transaminase